MFTVIVLFCQIQITNPLLFSAGSRHAVQKLSISPYITPRLTPSGTPKIISTAGSPRIYSSAGSPQKISGAASPIKPEYGGGNIMSSWYPSSQQSSAANSPPRGHSLPGFPIEITFLQNDWFPLQSLGTCV